MGMDRETHECKGCFYLRGAGDLLTCDYIFLEHHPRPCPGGKGCKCYITDHEMQKRQTSNLYKPRVPKKKK